ETLPFLVQHQHRPAEAQEVQQRAADQADRGMGGKGAFDRVGTDGKIHHQAPVSRKGRTGPAAASRVQPCARRLVCISSTAARIPQTSGTAKNAAAMAFASLQPIAEPAARIAMPRAMDAASPPAT